MTRSWVGRLSLLVCVLGGGVEEVFALLVGVCVCKENGVVNFFVSVRKKVRMVCGEGVWGEGTGVPYSHAATQTRAHTRARMQPRSREEG